MSQEIINTENLQQFASTAAPKIMNGLLYSVVGIVVMLILAYFVYRSMFVVRVRLRVLTSSYDKIIDTVGRFRKDKDGVEGLEIWRYKLKRLPLPPPEALGITGTGKYAVEIEIDDSGSARYIAIEKNKRKYEPFDTNDQLFYLNEMRKAAQRKKMALSEILLQLAPITAVIIIFVISLVYWGEVMQPAIDFGKDNAKIATTQKETVEILRDIMRKEQLIRDTQELLIPNEAGQLQNNASGG